MGRKTKEAYYVDEYYLDEFTLTRWIDATVSNLSTNESSGDVDGNVS